MWILIWVTTVVAIAIVTLSLSPCMVYGYWSGGVISGSRYGAVGAGSSSIARVGSISSVYPATRAASLPSGMVNVGGEIVDITNKVIQRVTGIGGTQYYSFLNQKTGPIFQTPTVDTGKHFVLFQDVNYPPGDGHYIVLKRWRGMPLGGSNALGGILYEAFYLDLGDSINALVSNWNMASYMPMGINGLQYGAYGGGMGYYGRRTNVRMTRASQSQTQTESQGKPDKLIQGPFVPAVDAEVREGTGSMEKLSKKLEITEEESSTLEITTTAATKTTTTTPDASDDGDDEDYVDSEPLEIKPVTENEIEVDDVDVVPAVTESGSGDKIVSEETTELLKFNP